MKISIEPREEAQIYFKRVMLSKDRSFDQENEIS